jgi:hypothetical protein
MMKNNWLARQKFKYRENTVRVCVETRIFLKHGMNAKYFRNEPLKAAFG